MSDINKLVKSRKYASLHMGRSCIDLYSNDIGSPFPEINSFAAYVGGSPTNTSIGAQRLGLKTALLTAVGEDPVGDFVVEFLNKEGVETRYIPRKPGTRTSCVLLGIEPPSKFPLVFYRDNCADIQLDFDDVLAAPIAESAILQIAGTNLSREPSASATRFAVELAHKCGNHIVLDLDFRPDQWVDARFFGSSIRSLLPFVDVVIGTEDEINASMIDDIERINLTHSQVSDARVAGETSENIKRILTCGAGLVVEKCGEHGCRIHYPEKDVIDVPGFPVEVQNILGAGDAFAGGFLYGYCQGMDIFKAARIGNGCGAMVVTRHACSASMPKYQELMDFVDEYGGL